MIAEMKIVFEYIVVQLLICRGIYRSVSVGAVFIHRFKQSTLLEIRPGQAGDTDILKLSFVYGKTFSLVPISITLRTLS